MGTSVTSADSARSDSSAQQRVVSGVALPGGRLLQNGHPGCANLGHPPYVTRIHTCDPASLSPQLIPTAIARRSPSAKQSEMDKKPPCTIERWVRAWEIVRCLQGWWEVK